MHFGIVDGVPPVSEAVFVFLHSVFFLLLRLNNLSGPVLADFFPLLVICQGTSLVNFSF